MPRVIAILWDFDKTLIHGYMQAPLFDHYGIDGIQFWDEVNALPEFHSDGGVTEVLASDFLYLNHILTYVRQGLFPGLNNALLRTFGAKQQFAPGIPKLFEEIATVARQPLFTQNDIRIENYVISTGLRQIVLGSPIAQHIRFVWGCEFLEREAPAGFLRQPSHHPLGAPVIRDIGYVIDHTTKTRAIFEINKGSREAHGVHVNARIPRPRRRVPFENMIYIADGVSDIPSLSLVGQSGGKTFGVYQPDSERDLAQAKLLLEQERVEAIGPADYRTGSATHAWLMKCLAAFGERLARTPIDDTPTPPPPPMPGHIYDYRKL